jgi:hypothetical protein
LTCCAESLRNRGDEHHISQTEGVPESKRRLPVSSPTIGALLGIRDRTGPQQNVNPQPLGTRRPTNPITQFLLALIRRVCWTTGLPISSRSEVVPGPPREGPYEMRVILRANVPVPKASGRPMHSARRHIALSACSYTASLKWLPGLP